MHHRILLALALLGCSVAAADTPGPRGRRVYRSSNNYSTPSNRVTPTNRSYLRQLLSSPEKMTEVFGPSILVREQADTQAKPAPIKQP